jgi:hypothetical protein
VGGARVLDAFGADDSISGSMPSGLPTVLRPTAALPHVLPVGSISSKDLKTFPVQGILGLSNGAMSATGEGDGALGSPWVGHNGLHRGIGQGGLFSPSSQHAAALHGDSPTGGAGGLKRVTSMLDEDTEIARARERTDGGIEPIEITHAGLEVSELGRAMFSLE